MNLIPYFVIGQEKIPFYFFVELTPEALFNLSERSLREKKRKE